MIQKQFIELLDIWVPISAGDLLTCYEFLSCLHTCCVPYGWQEVVATVDNYFALCYG